MSGSSSSELARSPRDKKAVVPARARSHDFRRKEDEELPPPEVHPLHFRPRGMHDVLPIEQPYWEILFDTVRALATSFNYQRIDPPLLEVPGVFERGLGSTSDVVEKELFFARDRSGRERLALRPEATAGVVRAYLEHGMHVLPQPVRLWYWGPAFRHDRPQAGRYRQFTQFGFEAIGEASALIDAQVIHLAHEIFHNLQLEAFRIEVNSMGHLGPDCRQGYIELLKAHAVAHTSKLCADCKRRARRNPLRVLDCKEEKCQVVANTAPKISAHLCTACAAHYRELKAHLADLHIPWRENPRLVRGFDYYTRTAFEIVPTSPSSVLGDGAAGGRPEEAARSPNVRFPPTRPPAGGTTLGTRFPPTRPSAGGTTLGTRSVGALSTGTAFSLGGGGRYDGLVELFGGSPTPAVGFAGGVERTILAMRAEGIEVARTGQPEIFLVHLGELGRKRALLLFDELRRAGFRVAEAFHKPGIKAQLRAADRQKISWAIILGQKEALDHTVIIRNMESGVQETIDVNLDVLVPALKKRVHIEDAP